MIKRQPAELFCIQQLHSITYEIIDEKHLFYYNGNTIRKIRIFGTIIHHRVKENPKGGKYISMLIDDGTDTIQLKYWENKDKTKDLLLTDLITAFPGQIIDLIGRINHYNNEIYIVPEIISTNLDIAFEISRRLVLLDSNRIKIGENTNLDTAKKQDQDVNLVLSQMSDDVNENSIEKLSKKTKLTSQEITEIMAHLQSESLIFMPKLGYYKKLNFEL